MTLYTDRSVLQPTPLVLALTNQLMSTLNRNDEEQPEETKSGTQKADDLENGEHSVGNYVTVRLIDLVCLYYVHKHCTLRVVGLLLIFYRMV